MVGEMTSKDQTIFRSKYGVIIFLIYNEVRKIFFVG